MTYQQMIEHIVEETWKVDKASNAIRASILNPRIMPRSKKDTLDCWIQTLRCAVKDLEMAADIYIAYT